MKYIYAGIVLIFAGIADSLFVSFFYDSQPDIWELFRTAIGLHIERDYFIFSILIVFLIGAGILSTIFGFLKFRRG